MKENGLFKYGFRGCFINLVWIVLAIFAVTVSAKHLYPEDPACRQMVGGGFPVLFICDDWGGGSPTGSWGKIDLADVLNGGILPDGFLVDFLFYFILIWIIWLTVSKVTHKSLDRSDLWLTTFIGLGFITGLLLAFLIFLPDYYQHVRPPLVRTSTPVPTSINSSPSAIETMIITIPPTQ
jgi:hypothetical protein